MKHDSLMDNTDRAEIGMARKMIADGRRLKNRVLSRLRMRATRARRSEGK